jgi:hypothetical protein
MRYALLICCDQSAAVSDEEKTRREARLIAIRDQLQGLGLLAGSHWLQPADTALTVRCWDGGDVMITEGPFVQAREQLIGWFIAECKDQAEAIDLATTIPAAWYGAIEVRPACGTPRTSVWNPAPEEAA